MIKLESLRGRGCVYVAPSEIATVAESTYNSATIVRLKDGTTHETSTYSSEIVKQVDEWERNQRPEATR